MELFNYLSRSPKARRRAKRGEGKSHLHKKEVGTNSRFSLKKVLLTVYLIERDKTPRRPRQIHWKKREGEAAETLTHELKGLGKRRIICQQGTSKKKFRRKNHDKI